MNPADIPLDGFSKVNKFTTGDPLVLESARSEKSLIIITKRFIEFLRSEKVTKVRIGDMSDLLDIPRRRLYDIIHVLEGINLVEKMGKSDIVFKEGFLTGISSNENNCHLMQTVKNLTEKSILLNSYISQLESAVTLARQDPEVRSLNYVLKTDVEKVAVGKVLTVIKASPDAHIFTQPSENGGMFISTHPALPLSVGVLNSPTYNQKTDEKNDAKKVDDCAHDSVTSLLENENNSLFAVQNEDDNRMFAMPISPSFPFTPFSNDSFFNQSRSNDSLSSIHHEAEWSLPVSQDYNRLLNDGYQEISSLYDESFWRL